MYLEFIIITFLLRYLRTALRKNNAAQEWEKWLTGGFALAIALFVLSVSFPSAKPIATLLTDTGLLYIVQLTLTRKVFLFAKSIIYAVLPYTVVSLVTALVEIVSMHFYHTWEGLFGTARLFSIIWMIGSWIMIRRQRRDLEKEQRKTAEKEREYRVAQSLKDQLELQVAERTAALTRQKEALQQALDELKATQAQLIQSEKMASLGELTAGIAHEIQNPLNFVNNFSELNTELIAELKEALGRGDLQEVTAIAEDISANETKINHHGKRADGIVKGMLQHSRNSSGQKEPTDINALADEYLRLAYHGLRAKDKTFNATIKTDFDTGIGSINVIPQDLGRVILNLITNAFYAVTEKKKTLAVQNPQAAAAYEPTVTVSTQKNPGGISISVKDNGNGIPPAVLEKVFQPFFTTKPSGQGTGLGLSMSYDIITKGHGGELKIENTENQGATFIIHLPAQALK